MIITFSWPRSRDNEWSEEVAVSLVGANVKIDDRDGKIIASYLDSTRSLQITVKFKEDS